MSEEDKPYFIGLFFGFIIGSGVLFIFFINTINSNQKLNNTTSAEQLCNDNLKSEVNSLHFENNKIVILCEKVKN